VPTTSRISDIEPAEDARYVVVTSTGRDGTRVRYRVAIEPLPGLVPASGDQREASAPAADQLSKRLMERLRRATRIAKAAT
jgi:hypothetical protein